MKKLHGVLLGLGVIFLVYLLWDIGVVDLWHKLVLLGWGLIPLVLAEGVAEMIHTVGWRHCLSRPYRSLSFTHLFRIRMAGYAINYLTPTAALGGEVVRATLLTATHKGPEAASGVLIEKACFAVSHLLFVLVGGIILLWRIQLPEALWVGMAVSSALLMSGIVAFLLLQRFGKLGFVIRWLAGRQAGGHVLQNAAAYSAEVDETMRRFYREQPHDVGLAIGWHLLGHSVGILQTWLFFHLLAQHVSFTTAACTWFLGMWFDLATFIVPLNLGTLEGSRIMALKAVGFDALLGMTYGVTLRLGQLFWSAFGLVSYGMLALKMGGMSRLGNCASTPKCPSGGDQPAPPSEGDQPPGFGVGVTKCSD